MVWKKALTLAVGHKAGLIFAGGVATALVGKKVLESDIVRETATKAMAEVMSMKNDAEKMMDDMKADAQEIVVESKE